MFRRLASGIGLVTACLLYSSLSVGQGSTARISGSITDSTGAVVPSAQVTVRNVETGVERKYASDDRGRYVAPELIPDSYEITVTLTGFETLVRQGITLTVGQESVINLTMKIGAVSERVTVTAEAPLVNTSSSGVSGVVDERHITELPLNGRDFSQLPLTQPGVISIRDATAGPTKGFGARVSMSGSRPTETGWQLDGTNINSVGNFGTPGSSSGVVMGVDAVQEFRVVTGGGYSAELGGYSGGVIQMVTKSGTNSFHGTAYEDLRNSALDSNTWANNKGGLKKPEFRQNQFGGSLGGPIKKDKLFFFGNYEGLRKANVGVARFDNVPDENTHKGILAEGVTQVQIAPEIKPYLDLWPLPNFANAVGQQAGTGQRVTPLDDITNENYVVVRADQYLTSNQTIFERFTYDNGTDSVPAPLGVSNNVIPSRARYATVQYQRILSPRLLSTSTGAFQRTNISPTTTLAIDYPKSLFFEAQPFPPTVSYSTGITGIGVDSTNTSSRIQTIFEFAQGFVYTSGAHSMKFGGNFEKVGFNVSGPAAGAFGGFQWTNQQQFLTDANLNTFTVEVPGGSTFRSVRQRVAGLYFQDDWQAKRNFTVNLGLRYEPWSAPSEKHGRVSTEKDWYHATQFDTPMTTGTTTWFQSPSAKSFSPRVGMAWDVKGDGKTAVRAGFGVFHVMLLSAYFNTIARKDPPFSATLNVSSPAPTFNLSGADAYVLGVTPSVLTSVLSPNTFKELMQWNLNQMYEMKFNFSIEREVLPNLSVNLGYVGSRGVHLLQKGDSNAAVPTYINGLPFVPPNATRPNLNDGDGTYSFSGAQSFYNGMIVEVKKRFAQNFQLQSSFTWSKEIDDATTGLGNSDFGESLLSQPFASKSDRGLGAIHLGRNWVVNGLWSLPSPKNTIASYLVGGWRLSSIVSISSGVPFSVNIGGRNANDLTRTASAQRPDLLPGVSMGSITSGTTAGCTFINNGVNAPLAPIPYNPAAPNAFFSVTPGQALGTKSLYFDPCAFSIPVAGFYGNLGRNTLIGPGSTNFDLSFLKSVPLKINEGSRLELHVDLFNLLNHPNFSPPGASPISVTLNSGYTTRTITTSGTTGQLLNTVGNPRQIQLGLKLRF